MDYYSGMGLGMSSLGQAADTVQQNMMPGSESRWRRMSPIERVTIAIGTAATPVLAYHGYKRNNSVGWAVAWGLFGSMVWPITLPVAFAQGFAKPRVKPNRRRRSTAVSTRRRRTSRTRRRTSRRAR